jgi:hypothetical protein
VVSVDEACKAAEDLGYPVLLKVDASGGGGGVYNCLSSADFYCLNADIWLKSVLIQKKIHGRDLDLSALFLEGELIHFSYSKVEKIVLNHFGPSSVRTYFSLSSVDEKIFDELREVGKALGAHGFTNITCIEAYDGSGRYYVETDMRPNVWLDAPRFFGENIAERITLWYSKGESLQYPVKSVEGFPSQMLIPFFLRLTLMELLTNRYQVWKFIPKENGMLIAKLIFKKLRRSIPKNLLKSLIKRVIPKKHHQSLKQFCLKWISALGFTKKAHVFD